MRRLWRKLWNWIRGKKEPNLPVNDLDGTRLLNADVSSWPVTAELRAVTFLGRWIVLDYDKAREWPGHDFGDMVLNANPWVIAERHGEMVAATWEWFHIGQVQKERAAVEGGHIKRREFDGWVPRSGERLGFFVSGLARGPERTVSERSNVVWVNWP